MGSSEKGNRVVILWKSQSARESDIKLRFERLVAEEVSKGLTVNQAAAVTLETIKELMHGPNAPKKKTPKTKLKTVESEVPDSNKVRKHSNSSNTIPTSAVNEPASKSTLLTENPKKDRAVNFAPTTEIHQDNAKDVRKHMVDKELGSSKESTRSSGGSKELEQGDEKLAEAPEVGEVSSKKVESTGNKPEALDEPDENNSAIESQLRAIRAERASRYMKIRENEAKEWTAKLSVNNTNSKKSKKKQSKKKKTKTKAKAKKDEVLQVKDIHSVDRLGRSGVEDDDMAFLDSMVAAQKTCAQTSCKSSNRLGETCPFCKLKYCLSHRLPEDHGCRAAAKAEARRGMIVGGRVQGKVVGSQKNQLKKKLGQKLNEHASGRTAKAAERAKAKGKKKK